jgi:hypothetical protein
MKRWIISLLVASLCLAAVLGAFRAFAPEPPSLARFAPPGALLYLEAKDFSGLLASWNVSDEKDQWLHSANYEVFSRSRLFLRLKEASGQFATAAGLPPDMQFVSQIAGTQSAVALYDIGKLQFLYITKLDPSKAEQTALLQSRAKFETRSAGGTTFYLREDTESGRQVAFATSGGYLLLATRDDLMAGALQLIAGNKNPSVESEPWWAHAVSSAGAPGDLRLVLNLEKIVPSPYFRSYWIQRNITDMKAYGAAVSDLFISGSEYREERVLLKKSESGASGAENAAAPGATGVADLSRLVPANAGAYRIESNPSADACLALLETKLLAPHAGPGVASQIAPQVQLTAGEAGGNGDLETRIDQPPLETKPQAAAADSVKAVLAQNPVLASLSVQDSDLGNDGVFVRFHTAVVLLGTTDWNDAAVRSAIGDFVRPTLTASDLGVSWQNAAGHEELDGLWTLAASVRGKYFLFSDDPKLLDTISSKLGQQSKAEPAFFVAGFNHAREQAPFARFMNELNNQGAGATNVPGHMPDFFSENMASLSSVLAGVSSEKIVVRDAGDKVLQTVTYEWAN